MSTRPAFSAARLLGALALVAALATPPAAGLLSLSLSQDESAGTASAPGGPAGAEFKFEDPTGDVLVPGTSAGVPGQPGVDLVAVRVFGETGVSVLVSVQIADAKAEGQTPSEASGGLELDVCFTWGDVRLGAILGYSVVSGAILYRQRLVGLLQGDCAMGGITLGKSVTGNFNVDLATSTALLILDRDGLARVASRAPPGPGDQLTGFQVVLGDGRNTRGDVAPNGGPAPGALTLSSPTANQNLGLKPEYNIRSTLDCGANKSLRTYGIEAGGKRGVPISVINGNLQDRPVAFSVGVETEGSKWTARMIPGITLPAASSAGSGNVTVNVIVDTPPGTKHKECATLRVRALDPADPTSVGETRFNVVAALAPGPRLNTFYYHSDEGASSPCGASHLWLNVIEQDPGDQKAAAPLLPCREVAVLSISRASLNTYNDVNPNHDLVLNTTASGGTAHAHLNFRSDGAPTRAKIEVSVITGRVTVNPIGTGSKIVNIGSSATPVDVDIPIEFTRESSATGDPSRILDTREGLGARIAFTPLPPDDALDPVPARPAGTVYFLSDGSQVKLPIYATVKRNVNEPGALGGLISLKALTPSELFANPTKVRLLNFTVLNEGATTDGVTISTHVTGNPSWTVQVLPPGPFTLAPGAPQAFSVAVAPPAGAREGERVTLDVSAQSQSDATASATASHQITATQGQAFADEGTDLLGGAPPAKGKGIPAPAAAWLVALAVPAGLLLRRRR